MPKHMYLLIVMTFLLGLGTGAYTFLMTRDDVVTPFSHIQETMDGFEISAYMYGGCERQGCATYHLEDSGKYTYLWHPESERVTGTLTDEAHETLQRMLTIELLEDTKNSSSVSCAARADGDAYRYDIRISDRSYRFDSCVERLDNKLFIMLADYFDVFAARSVIEG